MALDHVTTGDAHVAAHNAERDAINLMGEGLVGKIGKPPGAATGDLLWWDGTAWITTQTRFFEGTGNPNGQVAAPVGSRYMDMAAVLGQVEWVKARNGDSNQGWICTQGDSGWLRVGTAGNAAFQNTWDNYPGGFSKAGYRKFNGIVYLEGLVSNATSRANMIFQLPAGFRPASNLHIECHTSGTPNGDQSGVNITPGGDVRGRSPVAGRIALDGISFIAEA